MKRPEVTFVKTGGTATLNMVLVLRGREQIGMLLQRTRESGTFLTERPWHLSPELLMRYQTYLPPDVAARTAFFGYFDDLCVWVAACEQDRSGRHP